MAIIDTDDSTSEDVPRTGASGRDLTNVIAGGAEEPQPSNRPVVENPEIAPSGAPPQEPLERLMAGNRRFAGQRPEHPRQSTARRLEIARHQSPFAIILSCSDSRVPPEVVFDQGLGDVFVVRTAGNVVDSVAIGSIEYAVDHFHSALVLVLGHQGCGAIQAALTETDVRGHVGVITRLLQPAVDVTRHMPGDRMENTARENARIMASTLVTSSSIIGESVHQGRLRVVPMTYSLETGRVEMAAAPGERF